MTTLDDLLTTLPQASSQFTPAGVLPDGIARVADADDRFVAPRLELAEDPIPDPDAVLISAPAAVGKSMLAHAVGYRLGSLVWDVGTFAVGSGTFVGKLSEAHEAAQLGAVLGAITSGDYCVVLDALDEGYTRARSNGYEEFLRDLATQLIKLKPPRPVLVALGRAETVDLSVLILRDVGLKVAHYRIDYFDRDQADEYIDRYLTARGRSVHTQHPEPFERARDRIFNRVAAAISAPDDAGLQPDSFLGYAPVLSAIAGYLEHDNYEKLDQELQQTMVDLAPGQADSIWAFLRRLLDGLLLREQNKLAEKLDDDLRKRLASHLDVSALYGPEEQLERLLGRAFDQAFALPQLLASLPASVRADYEDRVAGILLEHPFVGQGDLRFASVVFRDYALAWALAEGGAEVAAAVRGTVRSADFRTSPLLGRFVCEMLATEGEVEIDEGDLTSIYDSLCSGDSATRHTTISIDDNDATVFVDIDAAGGGQVSLVTSLPPGTPLRFARRLAHAYTYLAHHSIELGTHGDQLLLGPDVYIDAPDICIAASDVRIDTRAAAGGGAAGVELLADQFVASAPDPHVTSYGQASLVIAVNHALSYPWASYGVAFEVVPINDVELYEALRELGKLMSWFRGDVRGNLSHPQKTMDALVAKSRVSAALFAHALERGLIARESKDYVLRPANFGINFQQVRLREANEDVREFLGPFLRR